MPKTYIPKNVIITYGGVPIQGFPDGEFVTITPSGDRFTKRTGADGDTSRTMSADFSDEVTFTLKQSSPSNAYLSMIAYNDRVTQTGALPLTITDLSGTTLVSYPSAWIRQEATVSFSNEEGDRTWTLDTENPVIKTIGGN